MSKVTVEAMILIIRGVSIYPSQIESVLLDVGLSSPYYQLVIDRVGTLSSLEIQVEMTPRCFLTRLNK